VAIYNWSLRAVVVLAVVVIMVGGFQWMTAGGNASIVTQAKDRVVSALIGLLIGIGSYALLNFINPELVMFKKLDLGEIKNIEMNVIRCPGQACVYNLEKGIPSIHCECKNSIRVWFDRGVKIPLIGTLSKPQEWSLYFVESWNCGEGSYSEKPQLGVKCPQGNGDCVIREDFYTQENPLGRNASGEITYNSSAVECMDLSRIEMTKTCEEASEEWCESLNGLKYDICEVVNGECKVKVKWGLIDAREKELAGNNLICCYSYTGSRWDYFYASTNDQLNTCEDIYDSEPDGDERGLSECFNALGY
jgi:type III secretory pathway component EscS